MGHYAEDLALLKLQQPRMSRFFKVALHCHSPLSRDWGKRPGIDKELNHRERLLAEGGEVQFIREAVGRCGCDIMVVTDHMRCEYGERVLAKSIQGTDVTILPGMEVNFLTSASFANARLHIIIVLPPTCKRETFTRLLPGVGEERNRSDTDIVQGQDLGQWIGSVHEYGGLVIAAHVESSNGIRFCFRQTTSGLRQI